jgi:hypothetical protein
MVGVHDRSLILSVADSVEIKFHSVTFDILSNLASRLPEVGNAFSSPNASLEFEHAVTAETVRCNYMAW